MRFLPSSDQHEPAAHPDEHAPALLAVLSTLACGLVGPCGIFVPLIPLAIALAWRQRAPFAARVAIHVLAFQMGVCLLALPIMAAGLWNMSRFPRGPGPVPFSAAIEPFLFHAGLMVAMSVIALGVLVLTVMATVDVGRGRIFRYPITSRFVP